MHKTAHRRPLNCDECATRPHCVLRHLGNDLPLIESDIRRSATRTGDVLAREGEVGSTVSILKIGTVFAYRRGLDGRARPIGIAPRGAAFGLFGVFGKPNQATAMAASAGRVCQIGVKALKHAAGRVPAFLDKLSEAAVENCGSVAAWSEAMRLPGLVNQLAYTIVLMSDSARSPVVELPTHAALAELLGSTRETVARGLALLESEGGIRRMERKQCEVYRKNLLARVSANAR